MLEPRLPSTGTLRIVLLHLLEQGRQTSHILCLFDAWYSQLSEKAEGCLRKHPLLLAFRRWERFARNVPSGEERGETVVFRILGRGTFDTNYTTELDFTRKPLPIRSLSHTHIPRWRQKRCLMLIFSLTRAFNSATRFS